MKVKIIFLFILIYTTLAQIACAEGFSVRFSIDKNAYQAINKVQQDALMTKVQDLNAFIDTSIRGQLPQSINQKLNDLKIKISFTDTPGRDGLFIPNQDSEHTILIQLIKLQSNAINALVAHEIYHAIHYHLAPNEASWIREGMAQVFEYITTQELNGMNLYAAINNPMTPLLGTYDPDHSSPALYGHDMLYFYYLYQHCGKDTLFWKISEGPQEGNRNGSFLIDQVLSEMDSKKTECKNFTESAIHFEVAKMHNQMQFLEMGPLNAKDRFFILSTDISPPAIKVKSQEELSAQIKQMPVLSSLKIPMSDYLRYKGKCLNCAVYYTSDAFPYTVSDFPMEGMRINTVLVKLRDN